MGRKPTQKKKKKPSVKKRLQQHSFLIGFWFPQEAGCMDLSIHVLLTMELSRPKKPDANTQKKHGIRLKTPDQKTDPKPQNLATEQ